MMTEVHERRACEKYCDPGVQVRTFRREYEYPPSRAQRGLLSSTFCRIRESGDVDLHPAEDRVYYVPQSACAGYEPRQPTGGFEVHTGRSVGI